INSQEYGSYKFSITNIDEENKVSNFLSLLDKKIELQSKKIKDLKLFKKGLHNKLFNETNGENYLLYNIAQFENGKGHENIVDENGNYILINSKFISTDGNVFKNCNEQLTPLYKEDITMVMSDLPNGKALAKCYYIESDNKYSLNQRICRINIKNKEKFNSKYLFYILNRNPYYLKFDDGVNQTNLKKDDILKINLNIPDKTIQDKNANILTLIDKIIIKELSKLDSLNSLKKGLMQNMFV
ncbi:MAG: restriction endonuclease subunit S, partial [Bacilli bacterium]|nr:restriction endonuclease subunit S [Bacilli bacterium]